MKSKWKSFEALTLYLVFPSLSHPLCIYAWNQIILELFIFSFCICLFFTNHQHEMHKPHFIWRSFYSISSSSSSSSSPRFMLKCYTTISKDTWKIEGFYLFDSAAMLYIFRKIDSACSNKAIITHWKINKWLYLWRGQTYTVQPLASAHTHRANIVSILYARSRIRLSDFSLSVLPLFSLPRCIW